MPSIPERRRVLLAGFRVERETLLAQFDAGIYPGWDAMNVDHVDKARFILQMQPCDVLVIDSELYRVCDPVTLSWLGGMNQTPVLLLADVTPSLIIEALHQGADHWLPRDVALSCPPLLAAQLQTAAMLSDLRRRARLAGQTLAQAQKQMDRLVNLLWESSPEGERSGWFNQRHMIQRLDEEVARTRRLGGDFSVVLGEVQGGRGDKLSSTETDQLATWTAARITRVKRRCDVAGQYGPHGFMLLLPGTTPMNAVGACRRLQSVLEESPAPEETPLPSVHACFGLAAFSPSAATVKALLRQAEERLDLAKAGVGERVEV